jgi:hypothetical protein
MDITEICMECRNFFAPASKKDDKSFIHAGTFTISGHNITPLDFIQEGQYFRIVGSAMNDGVYCNDTESLEILTDETFDGAIWEMSVPRAFLTMCADIDAWRNANEAVDSSNMSPYTSESFAGYSYQKGGGVSQGTGNAVTWQAQFSRRLSAWRRLNVL